MTKHRTNPLARIVKGQWQDRLRYGQYEVFFLEVDPTLAKELLSLNTQNRNLRTKYRTFARDMQEGNWEFNGETLKFSERGLEDGQHRLHAVIEADTIELFLVVNGLTPSSQDTMDIGIKRTVGDQLKLHGEENFNQLASMARLVLDVKAGRNRNRNDSATPKEIQNFVYDNVDLARAAATYQTMCSKRLKVIPPAALGGAYYLALEVAPKDSVDEFFIDGLLNRYGLYAGHPGAALIRRFENAQGQGVYVRADEAVRYVLTAWNHWRDGNSITKLQGPRGGWTADNFPHPL